MYVANRVFKHCRGLNAALPIGAPTGCMQSLLAKRGYQRVGGSQRGCPKRVPKDGGISNV